MGLFRCLALVVVGVLVGGKCSAGGRTRSVTQMPYQPQSKGKHYNREEPHIWSHYAVL